VAGSFLRSLGGRQYGMELLLSFLDGRGLPQVNRVIGLRFWLEAENHLRNYERGYMLGTPSRMSRGKRPVQPKSARRLGTQG
jgi:hypothetical protein